MENITENNKLIAEFMGFYPLYIPTTDLYVWDKNNNAKFHKSWDWLMPVVEKIEIEYEYAVTICWEHCIIDIAGENTESFPRIETDGENKFQATYNAIIEFIKWYNEKAI